MLEKFVSNTEMSSIMLLLRKKNEAWLCSLVPSLR